MKEKIDKGFLALFIGVILFWVIMVAILILKF
jgi:hypothetical protein